MIEPPLRNRQRRLEHAGRDERLARALRENLQRRKAQSRAREQQPTASGTAPGSDPAAGSEPAA